MDGIQSDEAGPGGAQRTMSTQTRAGSTCSRDALKAVAAAQRRAEMLAQDNAALVLQLNARPTTKQHSHLQRQVDRAQHGQHQQPRQPDRGQDVDTQGCHTFDS